MATIVSSEARRKRLYQEPGMGEVRATAKIRMSPLERARLESSTWTLANTYPARGEVVD